MKASYAPTDAAGSVDERYLSKSSFNMLFESHLELSVGVVGAAYQSDLLTKVTRMKTDAAVGNCRSQRK